MLIGSLGALRQTDLKDQWPTALFIILDILMGLIPGSEDGIILFYLIFYITMN